MGCGAAAARSVDAPLKDGLTGGVIPDRGPEPATSQAANELHEPSVEGSVPANAGGGQRSAKTHKRIQRPNTSFIAGKTDDSPDGEDPRQDISPENRTFLNRLLQKHFLFSPLEDDEREALIDYVVLVSCEAGQVVFNQGDRGDSFYLIQSGAFTVSIDDTPLKQLRKNHTFGELAMLYNVSRTATISCSHAGVVWRLDDRRFRQCMEKLSSKHQTKIKAFLDSDATFSVLSREDQEALAAACSVQSFQKGETILREGEVGDWMFIVLEGNVSSVDQYGNMIVKNAGAIIGSAGLMYTKKQLFGAKAVDPVTCLALGKSSMEGLVGSVESVLRRTAIKSLILDNVGGASGELDFFKQLTEEQRNSMIDSLEDVTFQEGEVIISKGVPPQFIIVIEGEVAISDQAAIEGAVVGGAMQVKEFATRLLSAGMTYGAKALVENSKMPQSAVASSRVRVHRVRHDKLVDNLGDPLGELIRLNEIKKVLSDVFLFKNLDADQIDRTIRSLQRRRYAANEIIVQQGEPANDFFLIQNGVIRVLKDGQLLRTLGRWDYFGERGLLLQEKRSATCQAENPCACLVLDAVTFRDIVGMFRRDLEHRMYLQDLDITMADLRLTAIVGRGTFGVVKLVHHSRDSSKVYALKCVDKGQVVRQHQQKALRMERDINAQCYHPCIVQFIKTFQDAQNVYFLTEFLGGGDLFYVIREIGNLTREHSRFYSASIMLGLEYLHGRGIMYRDLKPENMMLDFDGNAKLVDFGCCKKAFRTSTLVGTPEYLAPEVILGKGYTCAVDWWALGVMLHEFVVGPLPFGRDTDDQLDLFREILEAPLHFPQYVTDESAVQLISGLLDRAPELRIGSSVRGAKEIEEHAYFAGFGWKELASHYAVPPWTPDTEKLKQNWELSDESLSMEAFDPNEPGMEWCSAF